MDIQHKMNKIEIDYFKNNDIHIMMKFLYPELLKEIQEKIKEMKNENIRYDDIQIILTFPQTTVYGLPLIIEQK